MELSLILLICGIAAVALTLLFCFFGYRLARFLLPLCGLLLLEGALYIFFYDMLGLNSLGTWLFFGGSSVALYVILFLLKRIAGFFAGLMGSALMLLFIVTALEIDTIPYVYPACFTICLMTGILTVAYKKVGVIVSTALFGGSAAAYLGLFIFFFGVDATDFTAYGNILVPLEQYLLENAFLVTGVSLGFVIAGILVQLYLTGISQVLPGDIPKDRNFRLRRSEKQEAA